MRFRDIIKKLGQGTARYVVSNKSVPKLPRVHSKHTRAKSKPRNYRQQKRAARKRQKLARRMNRSR